MSDFRLIQKTKWQGTSESTQSQQACLGLIRSPGRVILGAWSRDRVTNGEEDRSHPSIFSSVSE